SKRDWSSDVCSSDLEMGEEQTYEDFVTDIITYLILEWLKNRSQDQSFMLMYHHKAPHRPWEPDAKHAHMYENVDIPVPATFDDDYSNRSNAAKEATMRIDRDLDEIDLKVDPPGNLTPKIGRAHV